MDVVALSQFGIGYSVAALGTATTAEHVKILMRQTDDIYFCFDGDSAGRKAAWRALENALPQLKDGKSLHFLFLPEEHDPDSYVRAYGKAQFEDALLHQSKPLSEYFWKRSFRRPQPQYARRQSRIGQNQFSALGSDYRADIGLSSETKTQRARRH